MRVLIATQQSPTTVAGAIEVFKIIREAAAEDDLTIPAFNWVEGPGCSNLAFDLNGCREKAEKFANHLCMMLMPSKWSTTLDAIPSHDSVELKKVKYQRLNKGE